jgi:hypothetical protein
MGMPLKTFARAARLQRAAKFVTGGARFAAAESTGNRFIGFQP